ncbi:hypothetical protein QOZ80_4AG0305220 [Eleusine coracana subsp. coracana]|nr:hypothetical protein QOZ80_4AG0305220 [Eleusine coracana subsp. coracana]
MATCSRTPYGSAAAARLTDPGMRGDPSLPAPEEEVTRGAPRVPAAAVNRAKSGKRFARVPMTKEEEETLVAVKVQYMEGRKELFARIEKRDELRKRLDEVLFKRRCWAATLSNQVFALRADIAHVRHQLRIGWKEGEPLPEELDDARRRSRCAFIMNQHIDKAMKMGLDAFVDDHFKFHQDKKMRREVEAERTCAAEDDGALSGPVAAN